MIRAAGDTVGTAKTRDGKVPTDWFNCTLCGCAGEIPNCEQADFYYGLHGTRKGT